MSTDRTERLINLVLCLLATRQYLTADKIRELVSGYAQATSDDAFNRMLERDKAELRMLGVPLETGRNSVFDTVDGYRIARRDYELGDIELEPDEAAALALAVRLWDSAEFTASAQTALLKLQAAGVDVDRSAPEVIEPRVRTADPAFAPLLAAVRAGQVVTFSYRKSAPVEVTTRTVQPWGVVSWHGRWYLVGHDVDRGAARCFRLSRFTGPVRAIGPAGAVRRPENIDLLSFVARSTEEASPGTRAVLWVANGKAQGLRRHATARSTRTVDSVPGDIVELELNSLETAASWIAGYGPDVRVLEPDVLAKTVYERLLGTLDATTNLSGRQEHKQ